MSQEKNPNKSIVWPYTTPNAYIQTRPKKKKPYMPVKGKKSHLCGGQAKIKWYHLLSQGRKKNKGFMPQFGQNRWERGETGMGLLFTADEAGGFSALSLIYLAFPSPGAGTEQHLIVLPVPGPFMCCQLLSLTSDKTKPSNSLHKKATEGLLPQSLRPGKGKK